MSPEDLKAEFLALLEQEANEQVYQEYIERHTRLVPREFVQNHGVHFSMVLRKAPFGSDYKSDFFFLSKSSDDWNAVFIELEKPQSRFFKDGGNDFHPDFLQALQQINQWKAWFLEEGNQKAFLNGTLKAIRLPAVMALNPTYNKYVVVFGRRREYEGNEKRRMLIKALETDDFKIMTYDSLVEGLIQKRELFMAVRLNDHVKILSDTLVDDSVFGWADPGQFSVSDALHAAIVAATPSNGFRGDDKGGLTETLAYVAPRLRRHT
jgi:Domain of unknown function (DUF4263)